MLRALMGRGLTLVALYLTGGFFLVAHADTSTLVWGGQGSGVAETVIVDGGTYEVPLNTPAPVYVILPPHDPEGEIAIWPFADLYKIDATGERIFIISIPRQEFLDSDEPANNPTLAWPSAGVYEIDVRAAVPPPVVNFENTLQRWLARIFFASIAHAQGFDAPIVIETLHFTIVEANTEPDPVIIIPGILGSQQVDGEWVIDPILHTYDDLIATLDANGYTLGEDLFPFPYNWRKSNIETAILLKEKIDEVKEICECDKVDLVAHSMGGLVARQYIQSGNYEDDVDQLIFLGTPHLGAPKAYLIWEGGELAPFGFRRTYIQDTIVEIVLSLEARSLGYDDLFGYVREAPIHSVQQLLPVYDYILDGTVSRAYPENYPINEFLENLNEDLSVLSTTGVRVYNFLGDSEDRTIGGIDVVNMPSRLPKWEHGYPKLFDAPLGSHGLVLVEGDGTVPFTSGSHLASNIETFPFDHGDLVTASQGRIFQVLTGTDPDFLITEMTGLKSKVLVIQMQSPADLLVVAPDDKKIGKDFNGQKVNQIPHAFYTGFNTDTEFITILNPLDGEYKIFAQGTGSGPYTVETNLIDSATTTEASFTGNTAPGITSELNLEVQEGEISPDALEPVVTYESTLADLERINKLKWINAGIYKSLKAQLQAAKKAHPFVAKILLQTMLKQLSAYRGKLITEQGYQILKLDFNQLIH